MSEVSVQKFFHSLESTFRRYLFTLNPIAENEPELRDAFLRELQEENAFAREPLLSVVKSYETGESLAALTDGRTQPSIDRRLRKIPSSELEIERPLYTHQIQSIRLAKANENFAVATGTGSGKTECFLLPILDDALRNPGPGVRAIIVYPMNALANDQLDRLRRLLVNLPEITFGRYTGDTPRDMEKVHQRDAADILKPNEQFTRAEIRSNPPHILLTNFAMLEYLLLRPGDNDIFRHKRLRFVVLDEAHSYSGAQGIEVSLLMRRVTNLYVSQSIQFILTSATLSGPTANAAQEIADFSSELTGGSFKPSNVLVGTISDPFEKQDFKRNSLQTYKRIVPDDQKLDEWLNCLDDASLLRTLLSSSGLGDAGSTSDTDSRSSKLLYNVFKSNKELADLHRICSSTPLTLSDVCNQLWKQYDDDALRVVRWLVAVGAYAARDQSSVPLLAGRYHFFFRGLAGASICIAPGCPDHSEHPNTFWSGFMLSERVQCPSCSSYTLPLKTCFQCGMPAVSVHVINQESWQALRPVNEANQVVLTWYDILTEEDFQELQEQDQSHYAFLCVNCQSFRVGNQSNCCEKPIVVRLRILHSEDGDLRECPRCGGSARPYPSALRAFASGEEAPTAVLAEAMLRGMPGDDSTKPAEGRRLLAFSDSRQRAAHFAPYLMRTAAESQFLYPLLQAISAADRTYAGAGAPFGAIASEFLKIAMRQNFVALRHTTDEGEPFTEIKPVKQLRTADRKTIQDECLISLLQNFTASGRSRMTIPGLGLAVAEVELSQHEKEQLQQRVPQLFTRGVSFGEAVVQNLLAVFLLRKAIKFPDGITLRHFSEGPQLATYHISNQSDEQGRRRYRWNAYEAPVRSRSIAVRRSFQLGVLTKAMALHRDNDAEVLSSTLNALWDVFRDTNILEETDFPNEHQLSHERILIFRKRDWFSCDRCARLTIIPLGELCPSSDCDGRMKPMSDEGFKKRFEGHHWYYRFMHTPALPIIVREHTAQLTNAAGRKYQREFRDKDLNVLSSSTTFEMGVDVGQLKAVFLRNVPPTPANYIQRAGRAGRRREGAAYAVTFARSTPHDQYHYHEPLGIVRGSVPVPKINLANSRLAQRHVNSFLLGPFLRSLPSVGDRTTVSEFFLSDSATKSPSETFQEWINANSTMLLLGIRRIIPTACSLSAEDALLQSAELLSGQQGVAAMLGHRLAGYEQQQQELQVALGKAANAQERNAAVQALNSVEALLKQAKNEQLIDFLASEHWLPSYAFPQDVVRLLVRNPNWVERMRLERDGEYGISEYAPGAEVIADGHSFTSAGIDLQHRELEVRAYRVCSGCRRVEMAPSLTAMQPLCECGTRPQGRLAMPRQFVEPPGFTTSWDDAVPEARLYRLKPPPNSEVFLIDGALPIGFSEHSTLHGVTIGYRADGQLFRANPGKKYSQFRICLDCGRSFERVSRGNLHRTPWGSKCGGKRIEKVDLGFRFKTDTLQLRFDGLHPPPPPITERSFWLSFQTAMVASAAEVLSIPRDDIDATHRSQSSGGFGGELVIYDRVPGGAGYVEAIKERLREILEATQQRVAVCTNPTCDPLGSCYVCLRTYGNQFQWELLKRNAVADWLSEVLHPSFGKSPQ